MAFKSELRESINSYARGHLQNEDWHRQFFSFIGSPKLAQRLGDEFFSARYIYKILEGLEADAWLLRAQVRMQVLAYASIYEAVLHHILFERLPDEPRVRALTEFVTKKEISIPAASLEALETHLVHHGRKIIPTFVSVGHTDKTKVRFDKKAECACLLGFVKTELKAELIELYEARNAIHIHAEIRKSLKYQIELSKLAYRRMEPFRVQVVAELAARGLL